VLDLFAVILLSLSHLWLSILTLIIYFKHNRDEPPQDLAITLRTSSFNIQKFYMALKLGVREKTRFCKRKKNYLSLGQCTRPQKCFGNGKTKGCALWIVGTSTLFPGFGSLWLLPLPKTQNSSSLVNVFLRINRRLQL